MLICLLVLSLAGVAAPSSGSAGQSRPDFSGTWDVDAAASKALTEKNGGTWRVAGAADGAVGSGGPVGAAPRVIRLLTTIKQTVSELVVERGLDGEVTSHDVYKLDGSESVNASARSTSKSRTVWKGSSLVTTGTSHFDPGDSARDAKGQPIGPIDRAFVTTRTLRPDGTMVVESRTTQNGQERVTWSVLTRVK